MLRAFGVDQNDEQAFILWAVNRRKMARRPKQLEEPADYFTEILGEGFLEAEDIDS